MGSYHTCLICHLGVVTHSKYFPLNNLSNYCLCQVTLHNCENSGFIVSVRIRLDGYALHVVIDLRLNVNIIFLDQFNVPKSNLKLFKYNIIDLIQKLRWRKNVFFAFGSSANVAIVMAFALSSL